MKSTIFVTILSSHETHFMKYLADLKGTCFPLLNLNVLLKLLPGDSHVIRI